MYFTFCSWQLWPSRLKAVVIIRNQKNFIKACNLNCLSSDSLKKIVKKLLFCPLRKQNYRICHSDRAFNARQIEISVEPVSVARGCRFTYRSRWFFFSLKGEEREIILIEEKWYRQKISQQNRTTSIYTTTIRKNKIND